MYELSLQSAKLLRGHLHSVPAAVYSQIALFHHESSPAEQIGRGALDRGVFRVRISSVLRFSSQQVGSDVRIALRFAYLLRVIRV